ncbi:cobaltochelatase subunit CobN [Aquisphaera insulae]|uniref:cobaltochelatase subunit CobN n=1 Tax=Aquisphaera insulae TaxID=2712864 RepID=UPI0013EB2370|nr:cobaltochelatase subunit CobN [Aquisphaera insulae]
MPNPFRSIRPLIRPRRLLPVLAVVASAAGLWYAWDRYVGPTRIAVINFRDFQFAELLDSRDPAAWVRIDRIDLANLADTDLRRYDAVFLFGRGMNLDEAQQAAVRGAIAGGTRVYVHGATSAASDLTDLVGDDLKSVAAYFENGGKRNLASLFRFTRRVLDGKSLFAPRPDEPEVIPSDTLFHVGEGQIFGSVADYQKFYESSGKWRRDRPKVALLTSIFGPRNPDLGSMGAIVEALEKKELNVYPIAGFLKRLDFLKTIGPDLVVYVPHGRLAPGRADEAIAYLKERGIPVLCPMTVQEEYSSWVGSQKGMIGGLLSQNVVMPELDGGIEPFVVSALSPDGRGLNVPAAIPDRVATLADRVDRWLTLRAKPNARKRLAIVYYKGPGQNAMAAAALDVAPSLLNLLNRLKAEGYDTGELPATPEELQKRIQRQGPVLGAYAEGAMESFLKSGDPEIISTEVLRDWARKGILADAYKAVEDQYGPAPGKFLTTERDGQKVLALPRVRFGNVVLLPQLLPAMGEDSSKLIHGAKIAPPYPYLATYLWARYGFKADALMHFGTHGSLEFTPWKQNSLSGMDWPDALVGDLPHLYIYIINNIGEAVIAKRRSYATLISHLTPPFAESDLYGPLKELQAAIGSWQASTDESLRAELVGTITRIVREQKIDRDLSLPESSTPLEPNDIERVHDYVMTIGLEKITRGLYVLGVPYAPDRVLETARMMGVDGIAQARARLDSARGKVRRDQTENKAYFSQHYYRPALETLDTLLAGKAKPEAFLDRTDLARVEAYDAAHRVPSGDQIFADMLRLGESKGRGRPGGPRSNGPDRETRADETRIRELLSAVAADPDALSFVRSLSVEAQFQRAASALDPETRRRAGRIASVIPAMRKALDMIGRPEVAELVGLMKSRPVREHVLALLDEPDMKTRIESELAKVRAQTLAELTTAGFIADLRAATSARPIAETLAPMERARVEQFRARLASYKAHADLTVDLAAKSREIADAYADPQAPARLDSAIIAADRRIVTLDDQEREYVSAVKTLRDALTSATGNRDALASSATAELDSVVAALNGRYVAPSSGGDAITNPDAVPTGRNLTSIDAEKTPSPEAWRVGKNLAEETIRARLSETGKFPKKVALTMWAGEFINTQGVDLAVLFHLLGVEPVRNARGEVHDIRLIPAVELKRPRVDVVVQTSGQLRDVAASRLSLIDRAVKLAASADDPADFENHVREGTLAAETSMKDHGLTPIEARAFATARVFGGVNGNYGTGIMGLVESGDRWQNSDEIAEQYLRNMGAVYTGDQWATFVPGVFEAALQNTDTIVHSRSSNVNGVLSLDHVYEFMGGLNNAVRKVTGAEPAAFFVDIRNSHKPKVQAAHEAVWVEARSTLLNPKYIKDLQAGGASAAEVFAETFRNTYAWNALKPDLVDDALWNELYAVYVQDRDHLGIRESFAAQNPYALQEMTAVMAETARKGLWKATPEQVRAISVLHTDLVRVHSPGCSGFVCDNASLREAIRKNVSGSDGDAYIAAIDRVREGEAVTSSGTRRVEGLTLKKVETTDARGKAVPPAPHPFPSPGAGRSPAMPLLSDAARTGSIAAVVIALLGGLTIMGYLRRRR